MVQVINMLETRANSEDKFKKMLAGIAFEGSTQVRGEQRLHLSGPKLLCSLPCDDQQTHESNHLDVAQRPSVRWSCGFM